MNTHQHKKKRHFFSLVSVYKALQNSFRGFLVLIKTEAAFQQDFVLFLLALVFCFYSPLKANGIFLVLASHIFILIIETLNTAIEAIADKITLDYDDKIKIIKDLGSTAVFLSFIMSASSWVFSLYYYL